MQIPAQARASLHHTQTIDFEVNTTGIVAAGLNDGLAGLVGGLTLYPNPANASDEAFLQFTNSSASGLSGDAQVTIYDAAGSAVRTQSVTLATGSQRIALPIQGLAAGLYRVSLQTSQGSASLGLSVVR